MMGLDDFEERLKAKERQEHDSKVEQNELSAYTCAAYGGPK